MRSRNELEGKYTLRLRGLALFAVSVARLSAAAFAVARELDEAWLDAADHSVEVGPAHGRAALHDGEAIGQEHEHR